MIVKKILSESEQSEQTTDVYVLVDKKTGKEFVVKDGKLMSFSDYQKEKDWEYSQEIVVGDEDKEQRVSALKGELEDEDKMQRFADVMAAKKAKKLPKQPKIIYTDDSKTDMQGSYKQMINELTVSIEKFARDIEKYAKEVTYEVRDPNYYVLDMIVPGTQKVKLVDKPRVWVYFDQSGSFNDSDIRSCNRVMAELQNLERKKLIELHTRYFADGIFNSPAEARRNSGSTRVDEVYTEILNELHKGTLNNVLIMTDRDGNAFKLPRVEVPGQAWVIFKNSESGKIKETLFGKSGTHFYLME